jgi:hypothetical protein
MTQVILELELPARNDVQLSAVHIGKRSGQSQQLKREISTDRFDALWIHGDRNSDIHARAAHRTAQPHRTRAQAQQLHVQGSKTCSTVRGLGLLDQQIMRVAQNSTHDAYCRCFAALHFHSGMHFARARPQRGPRVPDGRSDALGQRRFEVRFVVSETLSKRWTDDD